MPEPARGVSVQPIAGESHEGRQWGYMILLDGEPYLHATTGGTGPCWNLAQYEHGPEGLTEGEAWHVCELEDLAAVVNALIESDAHHANKERWNV